MKLIVCTGSSQLLTSIAAIRSSGHRSGFENCYFVFTDLSVSATQLNAFENVIKKLLSVFEIKNYFFDRDGSFPESILRQNFQEIWTITNWQNGNSKILNRFPKAKRICYGDSIGLLISESYFSHHSSFAFALRRTIKTLFKTDRLPQLSFDDYYLAIPFGFGLKLPSHYHRIEKKDYLQVLFTAQRAFDLNAYPLESGTDILLGCNFSESGRISQECELQALEKMFNELQLGAGSLFIKPHPRDSSEKLRALQGVLSKKFKKVNVFTGDELTYIPFEVLLAYWLNQQKKINRVIGFSSAVLGPKWLFNIPVQLGFGQEIVNCFFSKNFRNKRIKHEKDLNTILGTILESGKLL